VFAAVGGIVVPALIAILVSGGEALEGGAWAVPVATDIAFALGVLALVGAALPSGVRIVLLSIAVVDDLLAIALIAVIFTSGLDAAWLAAAAAGLGAYRLAFRLGKDWIWLLWVLGVAVWICVHASGIHATVAGIALALLTPVRTREEWRDTPAIRFEHRLHPVSAGFAVPVFALAAAGVSLSALGDAATDQLAIAIFLGLLVGKFVGILAGAALAVRLRLGALPAGVGWADVVPVAVLGGIGYTVSLLISQLAFDQAGAEERAAASVLAASVVASLVALFLLRRRATAATSEGGRDPV
jgi:NhaA family Na+:H+ antiporter